MTVDAATVVGWISVAAWLVVSFEQITLCYVTQSGEGLSIVFLAIWLAGDLTNLVGALLQHLLPTMIVLALYYTACDVILIYQLFYYRWLRRQPSFIAAQDADDEPVLSSFSANVHDKNEARRRDIIGYSGAVGVILVVGIVAFVLNRNNAPPAGKHPAPRKEEWDTTAQVVGWISAFLYLGSRIPQILKNRETKCQGLSLLMFFFCVVGNVTYVLSILLQPYSAQHILINLAWLVGSGGTVFLDFIVLAQFGYYRKARKDLKRKNAALLAGNGAEPTETDALLGVPAA